MSAKQVNELRALNAGLAKAIAERITVEILRSRIFFIGRLSKAPGTECWLKHIGGIIF